MLSKIKLLLKNRKILSRIDFALDLAQVVMALTVGYIWGIQSSILPGWSSREIRMPNTPLDIAALGFFLAILLDVSFGLYVWSDAD